NARQLKPVPKVEATNVTNKPAASGVAFSTTSPPWLSGTENSRLNLSSLDLDSNVTIGGNVRSPFVTPVGLVNAPTPTFSDLVYRPPANLNITNASSELFKSLSSPTSVTLSDGQTFQGTVVDAATGNIISNATIEFESHWSLSRVKATTDDSGNFSITLPSYSYLPLDPIQLKVASHGYKS